MYGPDCSLQLLEDAPSCKPSWRPLSGTRCTHCDAAPMPETTLRPPSHNHVALGHGKGSLSLGHPLPPAVHNGQPACVSAHISPPSWGWSRQLSVSPWSYSPGIWPWEHTRSPAKAHRKAAREQGLQSASQPQSGERSPRPLRPGSDSPSRAPLPSPGGEGMTMKAACAGSLPHGCSSARWPVPRKFLLWL